MSNAKKLTLEKKYTAFCKYVQDITGRKVIKARRGTNVQFDSPFISVDLIDCQKVPKEYSRWVDMDTDNPKQIMRGLVRVWFQVTAIGGKDYLDVLHRLHCSFSCDNFLIFQNEYDMGISEFEGVSNIAETLEDSRFDSRSQMKVCFYTPVPAEFEIGAFDSEGIRIDEIDKQYEEEIVVGKH